MPDITSIKITPQKLKKNISHIPPGLVSNNANLINDYCVSIVKQAHAVD